MHMNTVFKPDLHEFNRSAPYIAVIFNLLGSTNTLKIMRVVTDFSCQTNRPNR